MFEEWIEYEAFRPLLEDAVTCPDCGIGVLDFFDTDPETAICDACGEEFQVTD